MPAVASRWLELQLGDAGSLTPQARLRLFRDCRMLAAAVMVTIFPAMIFAASEPTAVIAALLLFGILPAAIAMDVRQPGDLDRAVSLGFLAASLVLTAAVMRGLPIGTALSALSIVCIEGFVVGSKAAQKRLLALFGGTVAAMIAVVQVNPGLTVDGLTGEPAPWAVMSLTLILVVNVLMLARGMMQGISSARRSASEQRILTQEVAAMVSETVIAIDRSGSVVRISDNAERILGLPAEALKGRGLGELVLVADRPQFLTAVRGTLGAGGEEKLRIRLRTSADSHAPRYRWIEIKIAPAPADAPTTMATLRDISEQIAEEERLALAAADAETARSARAAFLSTVNHELRTPLNAIIGFSEILANPATAPANAERVHEYATIINGAGQDLLRMVTTMIDITRLDSGVYDFETETTDARTVVEYAVEAFRQEPEGKDVTFAVHAPEESLDAQIDQRAFRHILHQILSNAAKFGGKNDSVDISLAANGEWVDIAVADKGPGIARDKLDLLGRHFARLDEGLSREQGGIGLGLSLARGLMALHGGKMAIDSSPGAGTTVTLSLRRAGAPTLNNVHPLVVPPAQLPSSNQDSVPERRRA